MLITMTIVGVLYIAGWLFRRYETKEFMKALDSMEQIFGNDLSAIRYYMIRPFIMVACKDDYRVHFNITNNLAISIHYKTFDCALEDLIYPNKNN